MLLFSHRTHTHTHHVSPTEASKRRKNILKYTFQEASISRSRTGSGNKLTKSLIVSVFNFF